MAGALHNPNRILLKENVPYGHVNVLFSCTFRCTISDCIPNSHPRSNNENVRQVCLAFDPEKVVDNDPFLLPY